MTDDPAALIIRPARPADKEAVLAFTRDTFTWGDYIDSVWDEWIADPQGSMIVGEVAGRVIGLDMMSVPRPGEGWFQGLRIDPAYRGRGYARRFEEYQLAEARRRGLHTVRLLTAENNTPVHKNAVRHGFRPLGRFRYHQARRDSPAVQAALAAHRPVELVPLRPEEAETAWAQVQRGPLWTPSAGCLGGDWVFAGFRRAWWDELVAGGRAWAAPDGGLIIADPLRPHGPGGDTQWLGWLDPVSSITSEGVATLVVAAMRQAFEQGYMGLTTVWPHLDLFEAGLRRAGWKLDPDEDGTLLLFAVDLSAITRHE